MYMYVAAHSSGGQRAALRNLNHLLTCGSQLAQAVRLGGKCHYPLRNLAT